MFTRIRILIGKYNLKKELPRIIRKRKMINLKDARKIGILYILDEVPDYDRVSEFVAKLQHDRKEVKALGFVKNKSLISRFLPKLSYDFFSKKDLNFFYKPFHNNIKDFIEKEFDILIDLSIKDSLPLKYISGLSVALCKVGRFSDEDLACFDLMIDVRKGTGISEYIEQVVHYLSIINENTSHARKV